MSKKGVRFNPENWSYEDYAEFTSAATTSRVVDAWAALEPVVVGWDYNADPHNLDEVRRVLGYEDFTEIIMAVGEVLENYRQTLDVSEIEVNLNGWSFWDSDEYHKAAQANNVLRVEQLMRQVVVFESGPEERMTFREGVTGQKAILERQSKLFRKR